MTDPPDRIPLTDKQRARSAEAIEQLKRDLEEAENQPRPSVTSPGKFTEPLGLDADGNLQPPLSPEEAAANEEVRRRATDRDRDG